MMRSASSYNIMNRDNKQNISCRMNRSTKDYYLQSKNSNNTSVNFNSILAWSSMGKAKAKQNRRNYQEIVSTIEETQRDEDYGQEVSRITGDGNRSVMTNCMISNNNNCKSNNNRNNNHQSQKQKILKILTQSDLTDDNDNLSQQLFSQRTSDQQQQMELKSYNTYEQNVYHHPRENYRKPIYKSMGIKNSQQYQVKEKQIEQQEAREQVHSPPFILIPNYKLQVKNYHHITIKNTINLSTLINLLQPKQHIHLIKTITKLTINNCLLNSLQGIQSFELLEEVNLRKNELRQVEQLYKISNKQKVTMINIQGNDIEYYHMATYGNLKRVFVNLVELNDKNYGMLKRKSSKYRDMRNVLKKSTKLECQLKNELKKQIKRTDRAMIRYNPSAFVKQKYQQQIIDEQQQQGEFNEEETFKTINKRERNNELISKSSNRKSKCLIESNNYIQQTSNNNKSDCQQWHYSLGQQQHDGQSFKKDTSIQIGKQLSLGSIENVPLTKSVNVVKQLVTRGSNSRQIGNNNNNNNNRDMNAMSDNNNKSSNKQNSINRNSNSKTSNKTNQIPLQTTVPFPTRGLLQIKTLNLDDENEQQQLHNNSHLHQPTATFAMQLQKQQQYALQNKQFMFRNNVNKKHHLGMQKTTKLTCTSNNTISNNNNNKSLVLMIENDNQSYNRQIEQQQQENQQIIQQDQLMISYGGNHQSMSLSQISEIPTKRMSKQQRIISNNNNRKSLKHQHQQQLYSKGNSNNGDYINQQQSFITTGVNDYFIASKNNTVLNNYNNSYLAYSQFTQYKHNESMDDDCLLKQNKNSLEQEKLAIATAIYMKSLITKSLYALSLYSGKRKNLPKRKQYHRNFAN